MKKIQDLLARLTELKINIYLENNKLKYKGHRANLTSDILAEIKKNRKELIEYFENLNCIPALTKQKIPQYIPLSLSQQRLWLIEQLSPGTGLYNEMVILRLHGKLNIDVLVKSINTICERHETLRTRILTVAGVGYQRILDAKFILPIETMAKETEELIEKRIITEISRPFDLNSEILFRGLLLKLNIHEHVLIFTFHHIISDAWSLRIFLEELYECYDSYLNKVLPVLAELPIQYKDYSIWQRGWLHGAILERQLSYWKTKLANAADLLLSTKRRPKELSYQGKIFEHYLTKQFTNRLHQFAQDRSVTLFMLLLAVFKGVLSRICGQTDIVIGTPSTNRNRKEVKNLIGFFVNTLVLRTDCSNNPTFEELLCRVEQTSLEAYEHQEVPFDKLVDHLDIATALNKHPLFQVVFAFQGASLEKKRLSDLQVDVIAPKEILAKFDLTLNITQVDDGICLSYEYATDLFTEQDIINLSNYYKTFIDSILVKPSIHISEIPILGQKDLALINTWNDTSYRFTTNKFIHEIFAEVAKANEHKVAVVCEGEQLTYGSLYYRARQLSAYLRKHQVTEETLVGLSVPKGFDLMIGILGIWQSGGVYVPLDPDYPRDRLEYMLQDAGVKVLLTISAYRERFSQYQGNIIYLDQIPHQSEESDFVTNLSAENLAYVIYTSGSTGRPKGVMLKHAALSNFIQSMLRIIEPQYNNLLTVTTINFDISLLELWLPLLTAGCLVIATKEQLQDATAVKKLIEEHAIDIMQATPTWWSNILNKTEDNGLEKIKYILCGGELLTSKILTKLSNYGNKLYNLYGPAESTIWSTFQEIKVNEIEEGIIGRPIFNTKVYILDENLNQLPPGRIGEIYIGGIGLARGYLGNPSLTAEKFIPNNFLEMEEVDEGEIETRIYKTGDLGRYLEDGRLEFLGRIDHQVKLRGFRIELGEIEAVLEEIPEVKQSVVMMREDTAEQKRLVAYLTLSKESDEATVITNCRELCKKKLPEYMQPAQIVILSSLPIMPNGKIDRLALPVPEARAGVSAYVAPVGVIEEQLAEIWQQLLKVTKVGRNDDFFSLGGNSLLATIVLSKINIYFKTNLRVKDLFVYRTIEQLVALIKETAGNFIYHDYLITNSDIDNLFMPFGLTNVQQAYYLGRLGSFELGNVSTHIYSEFEFGYLDIVRLEVALNKLIDRHVVLRTIIRNDNQIHLANYPYVKIKAYEYETDDDLLILRKQLSHKIYNPEVFPLFDICLAKFKDSYILYVSFDTLIMDGISYEIFFSEWTQLYNNPQIELPPLTVNFRDYFLQYQRIKESQLAKTAEKYWLNKITEYNFDMQLPLKVSASTVKSPQFVRITKTIKRKTWHKLQYKAQQQNISLTALLLTIYGNVLSYWSGQNKVCINLTLFNRLPLHYQINEIIGDFTVLELFNYIDSSGVISQILKTNHDKLWDDIEHNLFDGIDLQRLVRKKQALDSTKTIAPVVLTSMLGNDFIKESNKMFLDNSYHKEIYSITQTSQAWLDNKAYETEDGLVAEWDYVEQLFTRKTIEDMHNSYCRLIETLADMDWDKEDFPSIELSLEDLRIIENANNSYQQTNFDTLFSRYENLSAVNSYYNNLCVINGSGKKYSYGQLIRESENLAKYIVKINSSQAKDKLTELRQNKLIGVLSEKSYNQVVSVLAIIKAGYGYLPLSIDWPVSRIDGILKQGEVTILLVSREQYQEEKYKLLLNDYKILIIEDMLVELAANQHLIVEIILPKVNTDDIAYVIFTSGSTGKPKGVTITHKSALNTITGINERFNISNADKVLALSDLSFDLSVFDIFGTLSAGGTIIFPEHKLAKDPEHWLELINKYGVTIWNTVPQLAGLLIDVAINKSLQEIKFLRLFLLSGDWIPVNLPKQINYYCKQAVVMSLGGATEGSIWSIWYEINEVKPEWNNIPYGTAMPNQKMYILNNKGEHCKIGIKGDIYIGGIGVALNYWNDPDRTKQSFIEHQKLGRLYRTGDLGRWHQDGYIEFLGRDDWQVKIRGYRIELEEIDHALLKCSIVAQALTLAKEDETKNKYLISYVVPNFISAGYASEGNLILDPTNRIEFKLAQHNLRQTDSLVKIKLDTIYPINKKLYQLYFKRKSYRLYQDNIIENSTYTALLKHITLNLVLAVQKPINKLDISFGMLSKMLSVFMAIRSDSQVLPKYRYPSAGSLYPVQIYLEIGRSIDTIKPGYYYYNPVLNTLELLSEDINNNGQINLYFIGNLKAIEPLYGNLSKQFCYLELGCMVEVFNAQRHLTNSTLVALDNYNVLLVRNHLQLDANEIILQGYALTNKVTNVVSLVDNNIYPAVYIYIKKNVAGCALGWYEYQYHTEQLTYINNKPFDVSLNSYTNYSIYSTAAFAIFFITPQEQMDSLSLLQLQINVGKITQFLMEQAVVLNIGLCPIGTLDEYSSACLKQITNKVFIQGLFGGSITHEQVTAQSQSEAPDFKKTIVNDLKLYLANNFPVYMQPGQIILLDSLPLTYNGKIDRQALPVPKIDLDGDEYISPQGLLEEQLAKIWQEVLKVEKIGRNDNFFSLGGHSLLATQVIARIRSQQKVEVALKIIFDYPVLKNLAKVIEQELFSKKTLPPIFPATKKNIPLSFAQQRLWFLEQLLAELGLYHESLVLELTGELDEQALIKALNTIVRRHEVLRTQIIDINGIIQQKVMTVEFNLRIEKLTRMQRQGELKKQLLDKIRLEVFKPFDFNSEILFRGLLLKLTKQKNYLILTFHHMVFDGWSSGIFNHELAIYYKSYVCGHPSKLPDLAVQYKDYSIWQREWLHGDFLAKQLTYWHKQLKEISTLNLPTKPRPPEQSYRGKYHEEYLSNEILVQLKRLAESKNVTLFMVLLAAFKGMLSKVSQQDDVVVGTPIANRRAAEIEPLIGFFVNTLVLRTDCGGNPSFNDLLKRVEKVCLEAYEHQDVPFEQLVEHLNVPRDLGRHPLFQVMFILQNSQINTVQLENLAISAVPMPEVLAKFDLTLNIQETKTGLCIGYEYAEDLFTEAYITRLHKYYQKFIKQLLINPNFLLSEITVLDKTELRTLARWNDTGHEFSYPACFHELFERTVESNKHSIAVVYKDSVLTYEELNQQANCLARYLKKHNLNSEPIVGISVFRSIELIIGLLAILKSGGVYLPLDPDYPSDRLEYMLQNANAKILLTTTNLADKFQNYSGQIIYLDAKEYLAESSDNLNLKILPDNLAYVIYTSGSTGKPKGVAITHKALINRLEWQQDVYRLQKNEAILHKSSIGFDISIWELLWSCMVGAKLVITDLQVPKDLSELVSYMKEQNITTTHFVPSLLDMVTENNLNCNLKFILCSGEVLTTETYSKFRKLNNHTKVYNLYGPTEATIDVTHYSCQSLDDNITIGTPIYNIQIYILDTDLNQVPMGSIGEIYIAGIGLARGYLNNPSLTAERFIPNPFVKNNAYGGERLYKTGDLARYSENGNIEFLGRADYQVKIRGFRIELGEIEANIQNVTGVQQCIVLAKEGKTQQKILVAYVVLDKLVSSEDPSQIINDCLKICQLKLPPYMQVSQVIILEDMPLTLNGKVDRNALSKSVQEVIQDAYEPPHGILEEQLAEIWRELLQLTHISRNDNFFNLGGHSLLATQITTRIKSSQKLDIPLKMIFKHPILKDLAKNIELNYLNDKSILTIQRIQEKVVPLSFGQQRLWFLERLLPSLGLYHVPIVLRLYGKLNHDALIKALKIIVARHEILRTKIITIDGVAWQEVLNVDFELQLQSLQENNLEQNLSKIIKQEIIRPFNFNKEILFRGLLLSLQHENSILILTFHHIVFDGWSNKIFLQELAIAYESYCNNVVPDLVELPFQYKDYTLWQRALVKEGFLKQQLHYWQMQLFEASTLNLTAKAKIKKQSYLGKYYEQYLPLVRLRQLKQFAVDNNVTLFIVLLAAFKGVLSKVCNKNDIIVGTPIANRRIAEIEPLIGFFVNTLALRTNCSDNPTFKELLKRVEKTALDAYENQDVPFEQLIDYLNVPRDLTRHPLFQVVFVLQNAADNKINLQDLKITQVECETELAKFDLTLIASENDHGLSIGYEYAVDLFTKEYIERFATYYLKFVQHILDYPDSHISEVPILDSAELKCFEQWNNTDVNYPKDKCAHELFVAQVARTPKNIAAIFQNEAITYQELNARANSLAHMIIEKKYKSDGLIVLFLDRNIGYLISMLAIWKTNFAFIPLDPNSTLEHNRKIIEQIGVNFILTEPKYFTRANSLTNEKILVLDENIWQRYSNKEPDIIVNSQSLAYVIFTSGSTGTPKGAMIQHDGMLNHLLAKIRDLEIDCNDNVAEIATQIFDVSIWQFIAALLVGGKVTIFDDQSAWDPYYLLPRIEAEGITIFESVPSHMVIILEELERIKTYTFSKVRWFIVNGEPLYLDLCKRWFDIFPNVPLINAYGATECSDDITHYKIFTKQQATAEIMPLGWALMNCKTYIINADLSPVPIGSIGEICFGGIGVGRGYLDRPGFTAEKFIPNPFVTGPSEVGSRLYKTGDFGRYLSDGNIEFLGRIDHQVKIRGFRVELGEIESVIQSIDEIQQCVVLARGDNENQKKLVAYITVEKKSGATEQQFARFINICREICKNKLPDHMQPSQIVILEAMPLTPNGKIDRKLLPKPEGREGLEDYAPPVNLLEEKLANIWQEILNIDKIGRNDNFFSLGGDSIITIQMVSRARQQKILLEVKQVFETPTIAGLALNCKQENEVLEINNDSYTPVIPLLPIQQWFFDNADNVNHFNQASWVLPKSTSTIELSRLLAALLKIYQEHDAFKIKFRKINKTWEQYYDEQQSYVRNMDLPFTIISQNNWHNATLEQICTDIQSSLNIEQGPLSRLVWFEGKGLFWVIHHLIIDGISWRILVDDLNAAYKNIESLFYRGHSYQAWGNYLKIYTKLEDTIKYYSSLPSERLLPNNFEVTSQVKTYVIAFSRASTNDFIKKAQCAYRTQFNDLLLTALVQAFGEYTNYQLCLTLESHGRESLDSNLDLTRTIGWFTSLYPICLKLTNPFDLDDSIKEIKEQLRMIPHKGVTYGIAAYNTKQIPIILPNIAFNYLGQWDTLDTANNVFKLNDETIGKYIAHNDKLNFNVNINGQICDGVLSFNWSSNYQEELIIKILNEFKIKLELLIEHCSKEHVYGYTPSDFALVKLTQDQLDTTFHRPLENIYPLSPIQGGLLFQALYHPDSDAYLVQSIFELSNLRPSYWYQAWFTIVNRYDSLKVSFVWEGLVESLQIIHKEVNLPWIENDWTNESNPAMKLGTFLKQERTKNFDLDIAPLMRFNLMKLSDQDHRYYFVWQNHHLLTDGWSGPIILDEVFKVYETLLNAEQIELKSRRPYKDYIAWLLKKDQDKAKKYWAENLLGSVPTKLSIQNSENHDDYGEKILTFNKVETKSLDSYAKSLGVTTNTVLEGLWGILLSKYTKQDDVIFGATVSGRNIDLLGVEDMVGIFINTLPIRIKFKSDETIKAFLQRLQAHMSKVQEYGYISLSTIQALQKERNLFDNIYIFENYPVSQETVDSKTGLKANLIRVIEKTEYKLTVMVIPREELEIKINYANRSFTEKEIITILEFLKHLILNVIQDKYNYIGNISLLNTADLWCINTWNDTSYRFTTNKFIHEIFAEVAKANEHKVAVVCEGEQLTYGSLYYRARQLSAYLRKHQVTEETLVGLSVPKGFDLMIGILGIWQSGGVYVPLDPDYPRDRLEYMLQDAGVKVLLTISAYRERFSQYQGNIIYLDQIPHQSEESDFVTNLSAENLAYVIYTSGSTGRPKGVMLKHAALSNFIQSMLRIIEPQYNNLLTVTTINFDISLLELWLPLLTAGCLVIATKEQLQDATAVKKLIEEHAIDIMQATPTWWSNILNKTEDNGLEKIKYILCGGELLTSKILTKLSNYGNKLYNLYGPAESTIWSTFQEIKVNEIEEGIIGRPIFNTKVYILDENLNQLPPGRIGEIYIGGIGLARGYLGNPSLTAEKFIPNNFLEMEEVDEGEIETRIYKTGDLGRYLEDGRLEFLGRIDHQVKLRGFRIELGEIEAVLEEIPEVKQSVVMMREDTAEQKRLVAYLTLSKESDEATVITNCRELCKKKLPEYMQPAQIVILSSLPIMPNGKIDRLALPVPEARAGVSAYVAPVGVIEEQLAEIWQQLLKVTKVGRNDDFFSLGGHSLLVPILISEVRKAFNSGILLADFMQDPTIKGLGLHAAKRKDILVKISDGFANLAPLYLIHEGVGTVVPYYGLKEFIKNPIYAIEDPSYGELQSMFSSIEEMAKYYVDIIKVHHQEKHPEQGLNLGGWSLGGFVAFEMANLLNTKNIHINNLFIFETKTQHFEEAIDAIIGAKEQKKEFFIAQSVPSVFTHNHELLGKYEVTTKYPGDIIIIKATERGEGVIAAEKILKNDTYGWDEYAATVQVLEAIGDHVSIFEDKTNISSLAKVLAKILTT